MLFNTALPTDFESSKSSFVLEPGDSDSALMDTSIGQGKTLVTPFHMALIASAIANDGVLMKPYVIDRITDAEGEVVEQYEPAEYKTLLSERCIRFAGIYALCCGGRNSDQVKERQL